MNTLEWSQECKFISDTVSSVCNGSPVPENFNSDSACLARYLEMQRNAATREGFHDSAQYIQHCADDLLLHRLKS
jgi:hypothetical protein